MANLSDFLPAAGGSGGIGQTITVGDYSYPNARSLDDFMANRIAFSESTYNNATVFGDLYNVSSDSPTSYAASTVTADTYVTIANITSSTNGGGLTFLGGGYHISNTSVYTFASTVKITIDGGTAQEYSFTSLGNRHYYALCGNYQLIQAQTSNYATSFPTSGLGDGLGQKYLSYDTTTSSYYNSDTGSADGRGRILPFSAEDSMNNGLPFVYFENTIKIEAKHTSGPVQNWYANIYTF